jgi:hypothetical protein
MKIKGLADLKCKYVENYYDDKLIDFLVISFYGALRPSRPPLGSLLLDRRRHG